MASPGGCNLSASSLGLDSSNGLAIGGGFATGFGDVTKRSATASDPSSIALGNGAVTGPSAIDAIAFGTAASASGSAGLALGANSSAAAGGSVALGSGSVATRAALGGDPEAFSRTAVASINGAVSVGAAGAERQITNVAGGTLATDAVNVRQLSSVATNLAGTIGGGAKFDPGTGVYTPPSFSIQGGSYSSVAGALGALDARATSTASAATANASGLQSLQDQFATSVGLAVQNSTNRILTLGAGTNGTAVSLAGTAGDRRLTGLLAGSSGNDAVTVGQLSTALAGVTASGTPALASSNQASVATSIASGANALAIGYGASATAAGSVALGNGSIAAQTDTVSVGAVGAERRVTNVAGGSVSASSTEAVNGGQLYRLEQSVADNTARLASLQLGSGGSADPGFVQQSPVSRTLTVGAGTDGTAVSLANRSGAGRTVQGVADGTVRSGSTEAVNGGQLAAVSQRVVATGAGLSQLATGLGGGAAYNASANAFTGPEYKLRGSTYADVGSALSALDAAIQSAGASGSGANAGGTAPQPDFPIRNNNTDLAAPPSATGLNALATGHGATASGDESQAMGDMSVASGARSTSLGMRSAATADQSTAGGADSQASGVDSAAYGHRSLANAEATTAIGTRSQATYAGATAIGAGALATADPTTAVGFEARATGNEASAFGAFANAAAQNATALGRSASATGEGSSAVGVNAAAQGREATALGQGASAGQDGATALGAGARTTRANQVAVGTGRSTYTLAGLASTESRAAQSGATRLVTADAAGNLSVSDVDPGNLANLQNQVGALSGQIDGVGRYALESRREARQGIAAAMAMTAASMPSLPGRTSWTLNTATFRGAWAGGIALAHRLDTRAPIALTAGFSYSDTRQQGVRAGLAGEF